MTTRCTTWERLGRFAGRGLLIVNSGADDRDSLVRILAALEGVVDRSHLSVIASPGWHATLEVNGVLPSEILSTAFLGEELELNYLLENPDVIEWISSRQPQVITGSLAHSLYNDEIKEIFERRVCFVLGDGTFLAHTLPNAYVYLLGARELSLRFGRQRKTEEYRRTALGLLDALHRTWLELGEPAVEDRPEFGRERRLLAEHLGEGLLAYDEVSRIPVGRPDVVDEVIEFWRGATGSYLRSTNARLAEASRWLESRDGRIEMLELELTRRDESLEQVRRRIETLTAQMQQREDEMRERDRLLATAQNQVRDALEEIGRRESEIRRRDALLEKAREQIDHLMARRQGWESELQKRTGLLRRLSRQALGASPAAEPGAEPGRSDRQPDEVQRRVSALIQRIEAQDAEVQERDRLLREVQQQVQESLGEVGKRELEIKKRDELLGSTQQQIQELLREIEQRDREVQKRDEILLVVQQQVQETLEEVGRREAEIQRRDDLLRQSQKRIDGLVQEIESRDLEIQRRDGLLHEVQQQVQETLEEVGRREAEIQRRDDLLQDLQRQVQEMALHIETLQRELGDESRRRSELEGGVATAGGTVTPAPSGGEG